jgi:polyphosphate kinase
MKAIDPNSPDLYINRELSWLAFNQRVLEEADDRENPLFERLKFLAITASNLDEFYMVRVGSLNDQVEAGYDKPDASGQTPAEQLVRISDKAHEMVREAYRIWNRKLSPRLCEAGFRLLDARALSAENAQWLSAHFDRFLYPVLTPMAVDSGRPFPLIQNKSLNLGVLLEEPEEEQGFIFATVQVPSVLDRVVVLPQSGAGGMDFVLMEDVLSCFIDRLFIGKTVLATAPYRITRNGDLEIDEDEAEDLLLEIEKSLRQRRWGVAVRLELARGADPRIRSILLDEMELGDEDLFEVNGPLDLTLLFRMYGFPGSSAFKYPGYVPKQIPAFSGTEDLFDVIRRGDVLLHHPYESFTPVIDLVRNASRDPAVLAIKQTLYRVSGTSPIVQALAEAAENGKQVTVLVELKARFDEANNIQWAKQLEKAGCHVIYGLVGLKTHSKITLIVRMEEDGIQRYVHLSTGNYNDVTARIYTDLSLLTSSNRFGEDASAVFNALSGYSDSPRLRKIVMAPTRLRQRFYELIEREAEHARAGRRASIRAKMNALVDPGLISALYRAAMAGVKIDLLVRGMCSLRPGLPGISENITVRSIVGRYLEHSRIYRFENAGNPEVYLSSADWMERNMDRRVELLFPVEEESLRERLDAILALYAADNVKTRLMASDGTYRKPDGRRKPKTPPGFSGFRLPAGLKVISTGGRIEAQQAFMDLATHAAEQARLSLQGMETRL